METIKEFLAKSSLLQALYVRLFLALRSYITHYRDYDNLRKLLADHTSSQRIILIGSPHHRNLGDHAIAIAEQRYLRDYFPDWVVLEIPDIMFSLMPGIFIKHIVKEDILVLTGGGFLGNLWFEYGERMLHILLKRCPNNKIIVFPQTYYITSDKKAKRQLQQFKKIYQKHDFLLMFLRDNSYDFVRQNLLGGKFRACDKMPDIVLYLNMKAEVKRENDVILCLRDDKEASITSEMRTKLQETVNSLGYRIKNVSTIADNEFPLSDRETIVQQKLQVFFSAKLVITDRLHGMLFSVITGTPCIALNNTTGKVSGVWENWLQRIPYVKCCSIKDFQETFQNLSRCPAGTYSPDAFIKEWEKMAHEIRLFCNIQEQNKQ